MASRYWVGGTASWDATAGTKWATTSGGAGGASVPTSADNVYFDANSGTVTVTVAAGGGTCRNLDFTGFTGTYAGGQSTSIYGGLTLSSSMTYTSGGNLLFEATTGSYSITFNGKALTTPPQMRIGNAGSSGVTWTLGSALSFGNGIVLTAGTFTTNDYNVTATSLSSSNSNTRTINLGSSTVTLTSSANIIVNFSTNTNLTFNAGTSTISASGTTTIISGGTGVTFNNVSFTATSATTHQVQGTNTFNSLTTTAPASAGLMQFVFSADQTINGTLTLSAGTNATMRTFVRSNDIGTTRTLTCAAVASLTDIDFRDITIAGAAAPVSGTRLGDCKGNSGITFDAPKTVYWNFATTASWSGVVWTDTLGGTTNNIYFPLAQDTIVFPSTSPNSGVTVSTGNPYNIGTIDMSARTTNTMTLATSNNASTIYGNWINGTGTTLSGTGTLTFAGRGSQTITSAGKTFTQLLRIDALTGDVTLADALTSNRNSNSALTVASGMFSDGGYNLTLTEGGVQTGNDTYNRSLAINGTWLIGHSTNPFNAVTTTKLTVTGSGTLSLTSASAKQFTGGGIQTYPTLNQGGTGTLNVTGSNKFQGLTNTAIGRIQFTGGTTNEFTSFVINGVSGNLLQLGSTNTTAVTLRKTGAWNVGANSTDGGNNTGLSFTAGDMDYLSISYVTGEVLAFQSTIFFGSTNITSIYYGSTPVNAIYYGATQVF